MSDRHEWTAVSRRELMRRTALTGAGLALLGHASPFAFSAPAGRASAKEGRPKEGRARAVIQIWMWGGPCHLDTFDPKPEAGAPYCGPLDKPVSTNVNGIRIGQLLPLLAQQADKFSIIRSMTHGNDGHETAAYMVQTGHRPGVDRTVYPSVGAVVSALRGYDHGYTARIPPYVVLTQPLGRFSEIGFLGVRNKPFVTGGDPNQSRFAVEGIVAAGITDERQRSRRELLHSLDTLGRALPGHPAFAAMDAAEDKAYEMILGDAGKVFDLSSEPAEVRERYGRNTFGQSCLAARRLVEQGVPFVAINSPGWDTHKQHFETMNRRLPEMDRGLATLFADLAERGLLDSTIVWWSGEFGRTPKVQWEEPWNGGRGHYGRCFCAILGGGGFRGGAVVGASDSRGETVADRPVSPRDLIGSVYTLLGFDPDAPLENPRGLDVRVLPPAAEGDVNGGLLREIM